MKKNILIIIVILIGISINSCSSDSQSNNATALDKVTCKVEGVSKTLTATATLTNNEIAVTASLTSARSSSLETIEFLAYDNDFATNIYDFVYTKDGVKYTPETEEDLVSTSTVSSGVKLVGTFSGKVKNIDGDAITLTGGRFIVSY
jgi:hypothetical protein